MAKGTPPNSEITSKINLDTRFEIVAENCLGQKWRTARAAKARCGRMREVAVRPRFAFTPIKNEEFSVGRTTSLLETADNITNETRPRGGGKATKEPKRYY